MPRGRPKGSPNKVKMDIKAAAALHGKQALERLVHLMNRASQESVQVAAAKEILDRAYGKPTQTIAGDEDAPIKTVLELMWVATNASNAGKS